MSAWRLRSLLTAVLCVPVAPRLAGAVPLQDGTPVHVGLIGVINSRTTPLGQRLELVVVKDVVSSGEILIRQGAPVAAVVVKARGHGWDDWDHFPSLAFRFRYTIGLGGLVIALRASPVWHRNDRVVVDRAGRHHELQWVSSIDGFDAYVDGNYEL